jgi:hypothetical protein
MSFYTFAVVIVIPALIILILNLFIFKHVRASSRRIQARLDTNSMSLTNGQQSKVSRRDISLLKHTVYMLGIFVIGWAPIFLLIAIDYDGLVKPLVYSILTILSVMSSISCIIDLFLYNHELRGYIKAKFLQCF